MAFAICSTNQFKRCKSDCNESLSSLPLTEPDLADLGVISKLQE